MSLSRRAGAVLLLAGSLAIPSSAAVELSTDITVDLDGTLAHDEDVVEEDSGGVVTKIELGELPGDADLVAYSVATNGDVLFTLDVTASLPGGVDATPRDVVRWNGSSYSLELRGADHAVPLGAQIDAIGVIEGDLLLSFDVSVTLDGVAADDEDLLRLAGTQPEEWMLFFDGSAEGVPEAADLDGADVVDQSGHLALSFDVSGSVGGVAFDDDDVLEFEPQGGQWSKRYDGAMAHAGLAAADVDAVFVPEPGTSAVAVAAAAALAALRRMGAAARAHPRRARGRSARQRARYSIWTR